MWRQYFDMKRLIFPILILSGCGAQPAPEFLRATRSEVQRDGRSYVVFHTDRRVEVIRLGHAARGEHGAIRATMAALVPEVTGCKLKEGSLQGDSGEMRGSLSC